MLQHCKTLFHGRYIIRLFDRYTKNQIYQK